MSVWKREREILRMQMAHDGDEDDDDDGNVVKEEQLRLWALVKVKLNVG